MGKFGRYWSCGEEEEKIDAQVYNRNLDFILLHKSDSHSLLQ